MPRPVSPRVTLTVTPDTRPARSGLSLRFAGTTIELSPTDAKRFKAEAAATIRELGRVAPRRGGSRYSAFLDDPMTSSERAGITRRYQRERGGTRFDLEDYARRNPSEVLVRLLEQRTEELKKAAGVRYMTPEQEDHFEEYKRLKLDREMTFDSYLLNFADQDKYTLTKPGRGGVRSEATAQKLADALRFGDAIMDHTTFVSAVNIPSDLNGPIRMVENFKTGHRDLFWKNGAAYVKAQTYTYYGYEEITWYQYEPAAVKELLKNPPA